MNLLIGNIVARYCGIPSSCSEVMNCIDVVVMTSCCSMLLAELVVKEDVDGVRCRAEIRLQSVSGNICVGFRVGLGCKACRGARYCCRAERSCRLSRGVLVSCYSS